MDSFFLLYNADESGTEHTLKIAVSERPSIAHSSNVTVFFDSEPILSQETAFVGAGGDTWHAADESCHVAHLKTKKGADGVRVEIPGVVEMEIEVTETEREPFAFGISDVAKLMKRKSEFAI